MVIALLEAGADPNLLEKTFLTPLGRAVQNKDKDIGEILTRAGAAIQRPHPIPYSPVYLAISSNDVHMLKFLIQQGADASTFGPADWRDLRVNHVGVCKYLIELGVRFTVQSDLYSD